MNNDIRNVEFSGGAAGGVTVPINERLEGLMWGPEDKEFNIELWDDRTLIPDRLVRILFMVLLKYNCELGTRVQILLTNWLRH